MRPLAIFFLALAMSADAFAAAIAKGIALDRARWPEALRTGLIFGTIECATPLVGWALGSAASGYVKAWADWIAFGLLAALGVRMIVAAIRASGDAEAGKPQRHSFVALAATGLATSIDAMAVGAGLAFLDIGIVPIAAAIGVATFVMVTIGVMIGPALGRIVGRWAEALGGAVLIAIGSAILYQHLSP